MGQWPDVQDDAIFVDMLAPAGGTGQRNSPFTTLAEALNEQTVSGSTIALAPGAYDTPGLLVRNTVHLIGCGGTELRGALFLQAPRASLRGLYVHSIDAFPALTIVEGVVELQDVILLATENGGLVSSGDLIAERVAVRAPTALAVDHTRRAASAQVVLRDVYLESARQSSLSLVAVSATIAHALLVTPVGADFGMASISSTISLSNVAVVGSAHRGLYLSKSNGPLKDIFVHGSNGGVVLERSSAQIDGLLARDQAIAGLVVISGSAIVRDAVLEHTGGSPNSVLMISAGAVAKVERVLISSAETSGVTIAGSTVDANDVVIGDAGAEGINVKQGATVTIARAHISDESVRGLCVQDSVVKGSDLLIERAGEGLNNEGGSIALERVAIEDGQRGMSLIKGADYTAALRHLRIRAIDQEGIRVNAGVSLDLRGFEIDHASVNGLFIERGVELDLQLWNGANPGAGAGIESTYDPALLQHHLVRVELGDNDAPFVADH